MAKRGNKKRNQGTPAATARSRNLPNQANRMAPIQRLPDDVLREIFKLVIGEDGIDIGARHDIWDLLQVCVEWHNIVKSTPSLWSSFHADIILKPAVVAHRVQTCLKLSGTNPLSIDIQPDYNISRFPVSAISDIAKHCNRWSSLSLDARLLTKVAKENPIDDIIRRRGLSQLHTLQLYSNSEKACPLRLFRSATNLQVFELHSSYIADIKEFPWAKLRQLTLKLTGQSPDKVFLSTLRSMTLLEELDIWNYDSLVPYSTQEVVTLPSLRTFTTCDYDDKSEICSVLCVPKLTGIRLMEIRRESDHLSRMMKRSGTETTMKQLELQLITSDRQYFFVETVEQLHGVENLFLYDINSSVETDCVKFLVWNPEWERGQLLPSLQNFHLLLHPDEEGDAQLLQFMEMFMRSRSTASNAKNAGQTRVPLPLKSVNVTVVDAVQSASSGFASAFKGLRDLGKELGIKVETEIQLKKEVDPSNWFEYSDDGSEEEYNSDYDGYDSGLSF